MHKVAIVGSGNIGIDLMIKILRKSTSLEMGALVGIDPSSEGLARAKRMGIPTTDQGIAGLRKMRGFDEIAVVLLDFVRNRPEAAELLRDRTFARSLQ